MRWTNSSVDVRTRVHEYGGGSLVPYNDTIYYSDGVNNQLFRQHGATGAPEQLTNNTQKRYADGSYSPQVSKGTDSIPKKLSKYNCSIRQYVYHDVSKRQVK